MASLDEIRKPVAAELKLFEQKFKRSVKSSVPLLDRITRYMIRKKGKQMRPVFVFLSAKMAGDISESTYTAASLIELLHTATLVHDDVVDDADKRRGVFSIKALWKSKIAVLVGDYLLSKGMLMALEKKAFQLLQIVSVAVKEMSEGELLQIEKARRLDIQEDIYYEIIRKKTASFIASCCACGAASAGAPDEQIEKMRLFGEKTGMAFQIRDDLLDLDSGNSSGKLTGIDIKEQKMTLPLIYTLNHVSTKEKRQIINIIKNHNTDRKKVGMVIQKIKAKGGVDYATEKMQEYRDEALLILNAFPDSEVRKALQNLVIYTIQRKK